MVQLRDRVSVLLGQRVALVFCHFLIHFRIAFYSTRIAPVLSLLLMVNNRCQLRRTPDELLKSGTTSSHEPFLHSFGLAHFIIRGAVWWNEGMTGVRAQVPANPGWTKELLGRQRTQAAVLSCNANLHMSFDTSCQSIESMHASAVHIQHIKIVFIIHSSKQ